MFVELMANIKNEVLHNLFRSTSNLQAFENFLATLPQFLLREHAPAAPTAGAPSRARQPQPVGAMAGVAGWRWRWRRRSFHRSADSPFIAKSRPQRTVSLRQRKKIQKLLRAGRVADPL